MNGLNRFKIASAFVIAFLVSFLGSALMTGTLSDWRTVVIAFAAATLQGLYAVSRQLSNLNQDPDPTDGIVIQRR